MLQIIEMNYGVSPGGIDMFEVYPIGYVLDPPLFESENLHDAVDFCYAAGVDFEVRTIAAWEAKND